MRVILNCLSTGYRDNYGEYLLECEDCKYLPFPSFFFLDIYLMFVMVLNDYVMNIPSVFQNYKAFSSLKLHPKH